MCGIVGYTGKRQAAEILLSGLEKLEYRGYDSVGIAVLNNSDMKILKDVGRIKDLRKTSNNAKGVEGCIGIGHSRWATHGAPTVANAHPHYSASGKFAIVHNGIIENYASLKERLISEGVEFRSETDTEVVAQLLEKCYDGDFKQAVKQTADMLEGSYALGIICTDFPGVLFAVRRSSPLLIGVGKGENFIASDVTALISSTRNVIYLEDGEFAKLTPDSLTVYAENGDEIQKEVAYIDWDIAAAEKGGYDHFMLKEIMEQPTALQKTIEPRIKGGKIVLDNFKMSAADLRSINRIIITACGSASYAGQLGRIVLEKLTRIPVEVDLASELRYRDPIIDERTLLIVISQSGETADTIAAMKEAKQRGARVLSIVNVVGSTIAKLSDDVLFTWAGPEIAVATTKGYTTQAAVLYLFAVWAAHKMGKIGDAEYARYIADISALPEATEKAIQLNGNLDVLAEKYKDKENIFFIGRNVDYAVCMEGSLKLKEISYIHSEAYAAGELKHGTISLIDEGTPVIALCCHEALFDKMLSNIKEVKARGAKVLCVCLEGADMSSCEADDVIFVPRTNPLFNGSAEVIPLQILAYYIAKAKDCDIDKPRNLAKSVTVE